VSVPQRFADVELAKRDYASNIPASDRNFYYANNSTGGVLPSVEYSNDRAPAQVSGVVFKRGTTSTTIQVVFRNSRSLDLSGALSWTSARIAAPDANGTGTQYLPLSISSTNPSAITLPKNGVPVTRTVVVSGLPASVALGQLEVSYDLPLVEEETNLRGNNGASETWERLYVVDDVPVGLQAVPWTDFLEYACRWAFSASGQADMRQKMVEGMRYSRRSSNHKIYYNANKDVQFISRLNGDVRNPNPKLMLNLFSSSMNGNPLVGMQCADWAAILNTAFASQGYSASATAYFAQASNGNGGTIQIEFRTNALLAAPFSDTVSTDYKKQLFTYHAIVSGSVGSIDARFDASNSYLYEYSQGASWMKPVVAWPYPSYLWGNNNNHFGLIYEFVPTTAINPVIVTVDYTSLELVKG